MPKKPKKLTRPWVPERVAFQRENKNYSFYNSRLWRETSKLNLEINPLCVRCLERGEYTPADVTDHIKPINQGGDKMDDNNHQSLCHKCHNTKSATEKSKIK
tara:strand:+ start:10814 stop:11119 length:306 start_codon:yes stop_codon:yes gene_type:complete